MRAVVLKAMLVGLVFAIPYPAMAVNCEQVRRYLSTGRSPEDVSETMIISIDEVRKCQQSGGAEQRGPNADGKVDSKPTPKN